MASLGNDNSNNAAAAASLPPLPDPDDNFTLSLDDPDHPTNFVKPLKKKEDLETTPSYILGTLIVKVVAAKGLSSIGGGGGLFGGSHASLNPYALVRFKNSTQRTSERYNSTDPIWPRSENMFMDASLDEDKVMHPKLEVVDDENDMTTTSTASASASNNNSNNNNDAADSTYKAPDALLTVALFHTNELGKQYNFALGDSDDLFLGMASMDLTRLLTGKVAMLDKWLPLQGTSNNNNSNNNQAMVRVSCEYEPSDVPPKHGDLCRFTAFCRPQDLYPLEPGKSYKVEQVLHDDIVLLSYESPEKWILSFQAHRNMLIVEDRHVSRMDAAQDELQTLQERLAYSPLVAVVGETAERVQDDGLVGVVEDVAKGGLGLLDRWIKGGVDTVLSDLQHATNLDGRHNPDTNPLELNSPTDAALSQPTAVQEPVEPDPGPYMIEEEEDEEQANPYMPPCPITGFPMTEPVVAADGHSYEKSAILRWFEYSDKSPMTGAVLVHKELVPNYGLMASVQEAVERERNSKKEEAAIVPPSNLKKPPPTVEVVEEVVKEEITSSVNEVVAEVGEQETTPLINEAVEETTSPVNEVFQEEEATAMTLDVNEAVELEELPVDRDVETDNSPTTEAAANAVVSGEVLDGGEMEE